MERVIAPAQVIVIGGGIAGLTAACYLARAGVEVRLFERASNLGGHAASQREDGWIWNRGAHALYTGGAASWAFHELGVSYCFNTPKATFVFDHGRFWPLPASLPTLLRARLAPRDTFALMRFFAALLKVEAQSLASVSVQAWLEQTVRQPKIRALFAGVARPFVYSAALDLVSAEVFVDKLQRALRHPLHYIEGGWQSLVDSLHQQAVRAGVQIKTGTRIDSIEQEQGRVVGVRLADGGFLPAAALVIATRPNEAVKLLGRHGAALQTALQACVPAHIACLDVALTGLPAPKHPICFDLQQPRFLTTQSLYIQTAPAGGTMISTFKQLDPREPNDARTNQRDLEALIDAVQPHWRSAEVKRQFLPQIEAVGALPLASTGGFAGRPTSHATGLANCYLAGDWVGEEGFLVDASVASARQAAQQMLQTGTLPSNVDISEIVSH